MKTEILPVHDVEKAEKGGPGGITRAAIESAVERLRRGEPVVLPTETVYGLAAPTHAEDALRAAKGRDEGKPFTWAVASREDAEKLVDLSALGPSKLARRYWPGPLTLVAARREGGGTLGVRVPGHPVALAVLKELGEPLLLTSANRSGEGEATTAEEARAALDGRVALVLDAGVSPLGQPSTVVSFAGTQPIVHRVGVIDRGMVLRTAARHIVIVCSGNTCRSPMAEAMLRKKWAERIGVKPEQLLDHGGLVTSAGLTAGAGARASPEAVELLQSRGIDLSGHRSRPLQVEMVRAADLVLTMTANHRRAVLGGVPDAEAKVQVLDPEGTDVPDPLGGGIEEYRVCLQAIERALERRVAQFDH
jgi:protein-tyrosine phosphatase